MRRDIPMNKVQKREGYNYLQFDVERPKKREIVVEKKYRGYSKTRLDNGDSRYSHMNS